MCNNKITILQSTVVHYLVVKRGRIVLESNLGFQFLQERWLVGSSKLNASFRHFLGLNKQTTKLTKSKNINKKSSRKEKETFKSLIGKNIFKIHGWK